MVTFSERRVDAFSGGIVKPALLPSSTVIKYVRIAVGIDRYKPNTYTAIHLMADGGSSYHWFCEIETKIVRICILCNTLLLYSSHSSLQSSVMETSILVKFFAAICLGYVLLLGTITGSIPHSIAAVGIVLAWLIGRQISA
jgi:hypothetical protein